MKILFARTPQVAVSVRAPAVVVVPDPDTWNDYGLRLYAKLYVVGEVRPVRWRLAIMFEGHPETDVFLESVFDERGDLVDAAAVETPFVSLLREAGDYAELVRLLGFDAAIVGLRGLHDVVLGRIEGDELTARLASTSEFGIGMTRNAEQYVAMRRGGQGLRRSPAPPAIDAAVAFDVAAVLPSSAEPVAVTFDLEPDEIFRDRCCVLIGRNGVGKTQLLASMVRGLAGEEGGAGFGEPRPAPHRLLVFSSVATDTYPREIPPWSGLDYEYHPLIADSFPLGKAFVTAVVDCLRDGGATRVVEEGDFDRWRTLRTALRSLGLLEGLLLPLRTGAADDFLNVQEIDGADFVAVNRNLNEKRTGILFNSIDWRRAAVVVDEESRPRRLSSGELALAHFFAQATASIEHGCLLLFDEPETHLHPTYVSVFMDTLQDLLERSRSAAIIATHSSHVVREVPKQRVNILQTRDPDPDAEGFDFRPSVEVSRPRLQTFGSNVDDISQIVFGDAFVSHRYQKVLADWAKTVGRELGIKEVVARYATRLNPETLSFIQRSMEPAGD
jgi:energy-coupling factor transporter ATP-binding protein EcfA2